MAKAKGVTGARPAKRVARATTKAGAKRSAAPAKPSAGKSKKASTPGKAKAQPARSARGAKPVRRTVRKKPEALRLRAFSPGLTANDLEQSLEFYTEGLGFVVGQRWLHEGKLVGAFVTAGLCELGIGQDDWAKGRRRKKGEGVRIWCETAQDIDAIAARVRAYGGKITAEPANHSWGVRAFSVDDPDGYHLTFFKPAK